MHATNKTFYKKEQFRMVNGVYAVKHGSNPLTHKSVIVGEINPEKCNKLSTHLLIINIFFS